MKTRESLTLRRRASFFKPFYIEDYQLIDIHFFDEEGLKFSTGHGWFDAYWEDDGWKFQSQIMRLAFGIQYARKRKTDFGLDIAYYIPRRAERGEKRAELYIPLKTYQGETVNDITYHQYEENRVYYDLHTMKELHVGVLARGRTSEITREQADKEAFEEYIGNLEEPYRGIVTNYVERMTHYDRERDRLRGEIATRKIQLAGLKCPFWIDDIIRPIAEHLIEQPEFADRTYDILGPFGIGSRASIHLYKKGVPEELKFKDENCVSITFEPGNLQAGEITIVDRSRNLQKFAPGTLGELNGFNYPTVPMKRNTRELVAAVR